MKLLWLAVAILFLLWFCDHLPQPLLDIAKMGGPR